jgi:hypothetical protein
MSLVRWSPDTCCCVFIVDFESSEVRRIEPPGLLTLQERLSRGTRLCPIHRHLSLSNAFAEAWTLNRQKNQALAERDRG